MTNKELEEIYGKDPFGLNSCMDAIIFDIETLGYNPIHLLGEYELRAKQDPLFNKTMITALYKYIEQNNIKWDDNRFHPKK